MTRILRVIDVARHDWSSRVGWTTGRCHPRSLLWMLSCLVILQGLLVRDVFSQGVYLTHGPLVAAVTATSAKIWVRTNRPAQLQQEPLIVAARRGH
jgi:hypothetical protein